MTVRARATLIDVLYAIVACKLTSVGLWEVLAMDNIPCFGGHELLFLARSFGVNLSVLIDSRCLVARTGFIFSALYSTRLFCATDICLRASSFVYSVSWLVCLFDCLCFC